MKAFDLTGKRALITGASSGIGRQIAISFAGAGATCVISGRDEGRLSETLAAMPHNGHSTAIGDVTAPEDRARIVAACGQLDTVVHAAGIANLSPIRLLTERKMREVMAANYEGPTMLTQALLAKRVVNNGGAIIFIASIAAHTGFFANGAYSASKAALVGMMRCLAIEVAKNKVRVNCIAPSFVETPMIDTMGLRESIEEKAATHPLGIGSVDDVAAAAIFLAADSGRWITGQTLILDGGHSAG